MSRHQIIHHPLQSARVVQIDQALSARIEGGLRRPFVEFACSTRRCDPWPTLLATSH